MTTDATHFDVAQAPRFVAPELQVTVTAPLTAQDIRQHFQNPEIQFFIDCKNSRLKGSKLLTYLTNLDMPADVKIDLADYDGYSELLSAFIEQRGINNCPTLTLLAGEVVMHFAMVDRKDRPFTTLIPEAWVERFCQEHADTLSLWRIFLDSMVIYMGRNIMKMPFEDNKELPVVDDRDAIGHNVVKLLCIPDYLRVYFATTQLQAQVYFQPQFETPMFNGRDLAYYFFSPENYVGALLNGDLVAAMQTEEGKQLREYVHQHMQN
jgi:hypothetical protein